MSTPQQQRVTELLTALFDYDEKNLSSFSNSVQRANELEYPIPGERGMQLENMRFILSNRDSLLESVPQASEQILTNMEKDLLSTLQYVGYTTANPYMIENLRSMTDANEQTTFVYFNAMLKEEALRRLDENRAELETIRKSYCDELDEQRWARLRETRALYDSLEDKIIEIADDNIKLGQSIDDSSPERFAKTWAAHKEGLARLEAVNQQRSDIVRSMPEITYLPRNYQRKENEQLTGKLSKGFEWVQIAQEQVRQSILDDSMNLWEITPVVVTVLERMNPTEEELAAIEQKMISDQKKENRFKIGTVALSAAATIACFFLSGGAATALRLAAKAGAVTVATAGGIVMGVDELANALETERMVYASMYGKEDGAFTDEDIVSAKNGTRATAFLFALDIFGTFEAVQAWKMLGRFNGLSSRTQDVLGSLKDGKKILSTLDNTQLTILNSLDDASVARINTLKDSDVVLKRLVTYYNNDTTFISELVKSTTNPYDLQDPAKLLNRYANSFSSFDDFALEVGKRVDIPDAQRVDYLQKAFATLTESQRTNLTIPDDVQYVRGFAQNGRVDYYWPKNMGLVPGSDKAITKLPKEWVRVGGMRGRNFTIRKPDGTFYTYNETAIPYMQNPQALNTGRFINYEYFKKIDAIKNNDMKALNALLKKEKIPVVDIDEFLDITSAYKKYLQSIPPTITADPTYGIMGTVAEWIDDVSGLRYFDGGAPQIITPLSGRQFERLGIIK